MTNASQSESSEISPEKLSTISEQAAACVEQCYPGSIDSADVRETISNAIMRLAETGQHDDAVLQHYAEYHGIMAARRLVGH